MSKKNLLVFLLTIMIIITTVSVVIAKPELHKTFQIQILKFKKVDK